MNNLVDKIDLIIMDECHLQSKRGSGISNFIRKTNTKKVLGFTATPLELRSSFGGVGLAMINRSRKNLFQDIIHVTQVSEIKDNYWSKLEYRNYDVDNSILKLNSTGSDYLIESQQRFFEHNKLDERIEVEVQKQLDSGRKSILIFVPSVREAHNLESKIPESFVVSAKTPKKLREDIITKFKKKNIKVVINVNCLTVGFDHPELDCIIVARPTNSFTVHYQILGRGVRQHPNKESCLILDYTNNTTNLGHLENIKYVKGDSGWGMYAGNKLLTVHSVWRNTRLKEVLDRVESNDKEIKFTFGKFTGKSISKVPRWYLTWFVKNINPYESKTKQLIKDISIYIDENPE